MGRQDTAHSCMHKKWEDSLPILVAGGWEQAEFVPFDEQNFFFKGWMYNLFCIVYLYEQYICVLFEEYLPALRS